MSDCTGVLTDDEWRLTGFRPHELDMLKNAYKAITVTGLWNWLAGYVPEEGKGFAFSNHPNLKKIDEAMKYEGHSGFSYAWTMRQMETIAKGGWENYLVLRNRAMKFDRTRTPLEESAAVAAKILEQSMAK